MRPAVSVILPAFNAAPYVQAAVESVLHQTLADLELIAIDDGSTDGTGAILRELQRKDRRVRLIRQENRGLVASLNRGLRLAKGQFIARMDADDMCENERLELQVAFLRENPTVDILGSFVRRFGEGWSYVERYPVTDAEIRIRMLFRSPFCHPVVIFRRSVLSAPAFRYDPSSVHVEDFRLWKTIAPYAGFANLPIPLLNYRETAGQISQSYRDVQESGAVQICSEQLTDLGLSPSPEELRLHRKIGFADPLLDDKDCVAAAIWIDTLLSANRQTHKYNQDAFRSWLTERWYTVARGTVRESSLPLAVFKNTALFSEMSFRQRILLKLAWLRSWIRQRMSLVAR